MPASVTTNQHREQHMNTWENMIDGTSFGVIAGYLRHSNSGIDQIIHVQNRAMLAEVAALIAPTSPPNAAEEKRLLETLNRLATDGLIKFSFRGIDELPGRRGHIDANQIKPSAYCEVIYAPPFYLAHTPGLFEGQHLRDNPTEQKRNRETRTKSSEPSSQHSKTRSQGHSH